MLQINLLHLTTLCRTSHSRLGRCAGDRNSNSGRRSHGLDGGGQDGHNGLCGSRLLEGSGDDGESGLAALDGYDGRCEC